MSYHVDFRALDQLPTELQLQERYYLFQLCYSAYFDLS